ncbi:MAG TPA: serine/threonine-protein kinase, partial [Polyangiaceae bacterium]|nr:serine/threonine-protein kinase [Polyangiaceae bacterium]
MATSTNTAAPRVLGEPSELAAGTLVEGRYRVVRLIGVGGTGVVYEVEHVRTAQRLALKTLLDPQHAPRLEQEARALARLRSPHVVKVVDLGQSEAGPYFVMTLLEGKNLRDVLETKVKLGLPFVANLALQVSEGLDEAHRAGLVHRDLKPDNLHISDTRASAPKGTSPTAPDDLSAVTVFDFGVVKLATAEVNSALTRTGSTVGTPYYMSLEQLRGSGTVDAVSDVYAMSVVLYECLAGARPFEAGTLGDLIFAICSTSPAPLSSLRPDVPKEVTDVIMRGLSREKAERPKTMRELAKVFEKHGDAAFTLWLRRPEPARSAGPESGARTTAPAGGLAAPAS